jgi:putative NIF3 family GTP cyclohydrolase 1 type 2
MEDAPEMGINLIEAGHYFTEQPVLDFFESLLSKIDPTLVIQKLESNVIGFVS